MAQRPASQRPERQSAFFLQPLESAQPPQGPPQSTSLSPPFLMPSAQPGSPQWPLPHQPLMQFASVRQPWPRGQRGQSPAPQSTPVSTPFFWPSVHEAASQVPDAQNPVTHSAWLEHGSPVQAGQPPPQSIPVSPPLCTPSAHAVSRQTPPGLHAPVLQSAGTLQPPPGPHGLQEPPQSTPVSSPPWTPSRQAPELLDGGAQ